MIATMLLYLAWTYEIQFGQVAKSQIPKWFKPVARMHTADMYWDLCKACICNESDDILAAIDNCDALYWEVETVEQSPPKCKWIQVDEELIYDLVSMVKTTVSSMHSSMKKNTPASTNTQAMMAPSKQNTTEDSQTIVFQMTTTSQLTKQMLVL